MAREFKCYGRCGNKYPKEELTKFSPTGKGDGVNYCSSCLSEKQKESKDRADLYDFIKVSYNLSFPTGLMLKHIKTFTEEHGYTLRNIFFTLHYAFNVKKTHKPVAKYGLSVVPYYHDEMIDYYKNLQEKRATTDIKQQKIVRIKMRLPSNENTYREKKLINMDNLL